MSTPFSQLQILVSVGTQFPFDRLTSMVEQWMATAGIAAESVFFQVGPVGRSPKVSPHRELLAPADYQQVMQHIQVLVSHAGIGSILSAIESNKAVIIVPRSFAMGEHRNDHQSSTAREFAQRTGVYVATDQASLNHYLDQRATLTPATPTELDAQVINRIDAFIQGR